MLTKVLVSCALLVAAQADYVPSNYGSHNAVIGGYVANVQPAATVTFLPSYGHGHGYGIAPSYGVSHGYGASHGYGLHSSRHTGVDADAIKLASLALALPSPGAPSSAIIDIPQYSSTSYSAPVVVAAPSSHYGGPVNGASAAAAASNVAAANVDAAKVGPAIVRTKAPYNSIY